MTLAETLVPVAPPLRMNADGVFLVANTRVTLDTIVGAFKDGATADEIALAFDVLSLADIHAVIGHYLRHTSEVESYLSSRQQRAQNVRANHPTIVGLRDRLLARRANGRK